MKTLESLTHRVTADEQPDLWWLVLDTARRAGLDAPGLIELCPMPEVEVDDGRLLLGLPYVTGLTADELAAVIAHELAYAQAPRRDAAADAVAARIVSPEVAAAALVHGAHIGLAFHRFARGYVRPLAEAGWYPVDLFDGWRWMLRREREELAARRAETGGCGHLVRNGLAARVTALVGSPEVPDPAVDARPVPLRPLGPAVEAGFARAIAESLTGAGAGAAELRPATFDGVSDEVWDLGMRRRAEAVRTAAARVLGLPAAFVPDILDLVESGRSAEVLSACDPGSPDLEPAVQVMTPLVYEALRFRGYRLDHPLRQHVLVGPAHDRIDLVELLRPLECARPAPDRLRDILLVG